MEDGTGLTEIAEDRPAALRLLGKMRLHYTSEARRTPPAVMGVPVQYPSAGEPS